MKSKCTRWLLLVVDGDRGEFEAELRCNNKPDFLPTVRASLKPPG